MADNYSFSSPPPENLKCVICLEIAKDPKQHEDCGKLFCRECIERNGRKPCPICRAVNPKYFRDTRGEREINELEVMCFSMGRGCPWTGTVGTLDTHLATCEFALVPCPNKCEDGKDAGETQFMRKDLDYHLEMKCLKRPFQCQHCKEKGTYASITGDHGRVCVISMMACPNKGCPLFIQRGKLRQHMSVCEYTEVACAYENLGCDVRMQRKDIIEHQENDDGKHLHLMLKTFSSREEQHQTLSEGEALVFKFTGYASKKEKNEIFHSPSFYTHSGGYQTCINVYPNGSDSGENTHVSIFASLLKGQYDHQLQWPFQGTVTFEVLNQLADDRHFKEILYTSDLDMQVDSEWGFPQFLPNSSLCHDPATNTQYLLDDALYFRVSVKVDNHKPWLACAEKLKMDSVRNNSDTSKEHSLVFKVTQYNARNGHFNTNSFYTTPGGYNMCIYTYPNGESICDSTYVSIVAFVLEGSYDASLSWPFLGIVTFTLLNQLSDENHHSKTVEIQGRDNCCVGKSCGFEQFISQSALSHDPVKNTQYLKNDTLYFRVSVKDNTYKPWLACNCN